jgi:hypothetical protein
VVSKFKTFKSRGNPGEPRRGTRWWGGLTYQAWHVGYYLFGVDYEFYHHDYVSTNETVIESDKYIRLGVDVSSLTDSGSRSADFSRIPTDTVSPTDDTFRSVDFARAEDDATSSVSDSATRVHDAERVLAEDVFADDGLE